MLKMRMPDGTEMVMTGSEAERAACAIEKFLRDNSTLEKNYRLSLSIQQEVVKLVNALPDGVEDEMKRVHLKGLRLRQFLCAKNLREQNAGWTIHRCCSVAMRQLRDGDGFPTADSLHRYCSQHDKLFL